MKLKKKEGKKMYNIYIEYERRKAELKSLNLEPEEYDRMIAKVIKKLGI